MKTFVDGLEWLFTWSHWQGGGGFTHRIWEHVAMCGAVMLVALAVSLPIGLGLGHLGKGGFLALNVTNVGRALPSFGVLVMFALLFGLRGWLGFGVLPVLLTLVLLAVPPIVTNAYVGMREVDADLKEAARGMGMTGWQIARRVELPLTVPLLMAGIRTSAVQVVATATLGAVVGWGGLGRFIIDGFATRDNPKILAGAIVVGALAVLTEIALGLLQRAVSPHALDSQGPGVDVTVAPLPVDGSAQ
jgi:osmoprotectant transport system permease protein